MTIYIAGRITGDPEYRMKFTARASAIQRAGHRAINPAVLPDGLPWEACMRICFAMIDAADAAVFLPDWRPGRYVWKLANPIFFPEPVPEKGRQGWWKWPKDEAPKEAGHE